VPTGERQSNHIDMNNSASVTGLEDWTTFNQLKYGSNFWIP